MAGSTYTYCFGGCAVDWLYNNTDKLDLNKYGGVVGVDHYWTNQVWQQENFAFNLSDSLITLFSL